MLQIQKGMQAKSKAGHDKGKIYTIAEVDENYVYLINNGSRTADCPKKKRKKHIQIIYRR